jgi:hypothetical protein
LDSKKFRKAYPRLKEYIFAALIAKANDLDLIALEKGEISISQAVDLLKETMEQFANFGFHTIGEKLKEDANYFYKSTGFLDFILNLVPSENHIIDEEIEEL